MDYRVHHYRSADGRLDLVARDYPAHEGAPVMLMMHGLTRNSADFEPLLDKLAGRYRMIVPDQRGRGASQWDPDPAQYRPDVYAQDMLALMDDLGVTRAGLVGTSMGGLMAMVMQAMRPDLAQAAIFNDIGPVLDPAGLARIQGYVGPGGKMADWTEAAARTRAINAPAFPDFGGAQWDAFARRIARENADGTVSFAYDPAISESIAGDDPQTVPPDLWPLWELLGAVPVLVVRGALSDLLSTATVNEMARRHSGPYAAVEVPRVGHAPILDEPVALAAIEAFLKVHLPSSRT
ncbi:alpha/beta hydrolase [Novosphingobium resinovorum]|uniref:Alpha/beta hydrolase n=1 Tax=Novosphingobium resinovorum TaxID=158500 RepID=A0A031JRC3_9SPHN|nr:MULTISPECIES: alpha/beta hydrolase [Novosphingobium]EZP79505.1 Alpha/beta hydrolase [Novosphingobium resinovorum]MBF7010419.1 alpha/beta hydrolase [Novosphingobium sp. HR1a]WJM28420.1 alpha/beta hydrolase [Novosphingobium resinovorum]